MNTNAAESDAIEAGQPIAQEALIERAAERVRENRDEISNKGAAFYYGRANDGIAADHNLTIPEAVLMYGTDYGRVIAEGTHAESGYRNFNPENLDWFSIICTPLSDYALSWSEQCFILLGWGDSEIFFELWGKQGAGFLPRATESLSEGQRELVEQAIGFGKTCNLLYSLHIRQLSSGNLFEQAWHAQCR